MNKNISQEELALNYAKKGIVLALFSGFIFAFNGILITKGRSLAPFDDPRFFLLAPIICGGLNDLCACILSTTYNAGKGRLPELWRCLISRPGRFVIAGAFIGSFLGMGGYMLALQMAGPAYTLPVTTLYPAVAAVLAVIFLKEKVNLLAWAGLAACIGGAITIGYVPPTGGGGTFFYFGLFCALVAAIGWGVEGVLATAGMDFIDPPIALNIYYITSTALYWLLLIPLIATFFAGESTSIAHIPDFIFSSGAFYIGGAGVVGIVAYSAWYQSMLMTGVSRSMALNVSYALWGILLTALFIGVEITANLIIGAVVIFLGMILVIGHPKDLLNLRKID